MSLEFLIEITSNFCEGNILGTGAFGQVYKVSTILFFSRLSMQYCLLIKIFTKENISVHVIHINLNLLSTT
jgi:hypothetical protein